MSESNVPRLAKWPFLVGDLLFLGLVFGVVNLSEHPMQAWLVAFYGICVAAGAWLAILPYLTEYRAEVKLAEAGGLATTVEQIRNLELVSAQVTSTGSQLQSALDQSAKTVAAADAIATRMTAEAKAFAEFMNKANDTEKSHLRLEVEKLRRAEADWVQVVVRMLDHTFALHQAAQRSSQTNVITQLTSFQNACRDVARRVGLAPFAPNPGDLFDAQAHQLADSEAQAPAGARVGEVLATGFKFQGQPIRPALVRLESGVDQSVVQQELPQSIDTAEQDRGSGVEEGRQPELAPE